MEAIAKSVTLMALVAVIAVAGGVWEVKMADALTAAQCKQERDLGIKACQPVIYGKNPSPECCQRVRVTHLECVCPVITPKFAALIDINRAIRLIEGCGRKVPPHYKCGSITTPP